MSSSFFPPTTTAREEPQHLLRFPPPDHNGNDEGNRRYNDGYNLPSAKLIPITVGGGARTFYGGLDFGYADLGRSCSFLFPSVDQSVDYGMR